MKTYLRTLRPGGIVAFHLSNRYYELRAAVSHRRRDRSASARWGSATSRARPAVDLEAARSSSWVVVGRPEDIARFKALGWTEPFDGPILTDDFSDTLRLLRFP